MSFTEYILYSIYMYSFDFLMKYHILKCELWLSLKVEFSIIIKDMYFKFMIK